MCVIIRENLIGAKILMLNIKMLRSEEIAALKLRELYELHGYSFYRMKRFEEYDFYANKKDFLTSKSILTFTDLNGKLMALRPDVTLSIIKGIKNSSDVQKFYYDEKVYRSGKNEKNSFREISQAGIECVMPEKTEKNFNDENICEVIELALLSLETLAKGRKYILDVSNAGLIAELLNREKSSLSETEKILKCLAEKNIHELENLNAPDEFIELAKIEGNINDALPKLKNMNLKGAENFADIINSETLRKYHGKINIDFSTVNNLNYYNGIIFRGYIEGIPESILSGGQYDNLMSLMGHKNSKAIGFAVYIDLIEMKGGEND